MSSFRPEVQSFVQAAQVLIVSTMLLAPLTDEEDRAAADCLMRLQERLFPDR
jgi:hypothetical protein